jgi:hypothetical protein
MLKKFYKLFLILLLFIPYLIEAKTFFAENYTRENDFGVNTKFDDLETSSSNDDLFYTFAIGNSLVLDHTYLLKGTDVKEKEKKLEKPPTGGGVIIEQFIAGLFGGFIGWYLGMLGGAIIGSIVDTYDEELTNIIGAFIGFPFVCARSIYWSQDRKGITGSFKATLIGSYPGLIMLLIPNDVAAIGIIISPLGAATGFNLTKRYKEIPSSETGLINYKDNKMSFNIPTINIKPDPFNEKKLYQSIDLVRLRF